jgi:RimJ/RimL family protein N-acetyltransferase
MPGLAEPAPSLSPAPVPTRVRDKAGRWFAVRPLEAGDRAALDAFYEAFDPKRVAQGLPPDGAPRVERWLNTILPGGTHLVVECEGRLVGHAMLIPTQRPGMSEYAIFLAREVRGQGVGTEVNRVAVEQARALELTRLWLSVEPDNRPALRSYEKAGFRVVPGTQYTSELEMELDLSEGAETPSGMMMSRSL